MMKSPSSMTLSGFVVRAHRQGDDAVIPLHAHDTTNLGLCVEGSFLETLGARSVTMTDATLIGRPAGEAHENRFGFAPARYITIEFFAEIDRTAMAETDLLHRPFLRESPFVADSAHRIDRELRFRDTVSPLVVESLVHELIGHAQRSRERPLMHRERVGWLRRAVEILREPPAGCRPAVLSAVAAEVGIHPSHFARVFRREVGCPVGEYVRAWRLDEAVRLLRTTRRELAEIALATGFVDQSHFSTAFRRRYGITPGKFRVALGWRRSPDAAHARTQR